MYNLKHGSGGKKLVLSLDRERCMLMTEAEKRRERRARQKQRRREEPLDSRDACGVSDPTPMKAIGNIIRGR